MLEKRPIVINRSLAGTTKIELIATLLRDLGHEVEVISQGEISQQEWQYYPALLEADLFDPQIPVFYSSALPIRRVNGWWSKMATLRYFKSRHAARPFDVVIIYNLKTAQIGCASHAIRRLGLPVILEYEDDVFVNVNGETERGSWFKNNQAVGYRNIMVTVSAGIAASPHLLSQFPAETPALLLRGVIGGDILASSKRNDRTKKKMVLFSGTHTKSKGIEPLIRAWRSLANDEWELHITGSGELTEVLKKMAQGIKGIVFHGFVTRAQLVELLSTAKICINPHETSQTPGNVFAFKLIEYLAAGAHVITTPMGPLEGGLEAGITYIPDNAPATIEEALRQVIRDGHTESIAAKAAQDLYGPTAVTKSLDELLVRVVAGKSKRKNS